ncbi:hypothetical protein EMCG_04512 [[Emmonsia] crescens]|uniref:Uncharacterized protein n=1 Tax=[Emmonsia] crescens TaxID=73230 RepID=A0A0G2J7D5_9EURO|nr:hypothetical protein EMCG_04512 [Emmonsia crescens UAMH 3008]
MRHNKKDSGYGEDRAAFDVYRYASLAISLDPFCRRVHDMPQGKTASKANKASAYVIELQ